jgi:hypothetical protein
MQVLGSQLARSWSKRTVPNVLLKAYGGLRRICAGASPKTITNPPGGDVRAALLKPKTAALAAAVVMLLLVSAAACGGSQTSSSSTKTPLWSFASAPKLAPPILTVTDPGNSAPGYIFVAPTQIGLPIQWAGPEILSSTGQPVWMLPAPPGQMAMDFREQSYKGQPVLTFWQGALSTMGIGQGLDVIMNSAYQTIATLHAGNGFQADFHEFTIAPDGTAWITAYKANPTDLTAYGGPAKGTLWDSVVQQIDIATGKVLFQWDPLQHLSPNESLVPPTNGVWDPFHINSIDLNAAGDLLISARDTWTVYEVDAKSGTVLWRLGGRQSSFTLGAGVSFAYQHDARFLTNNTISLFDNEAAAAVGLQSRGLIIKLDAANHTATLLHQYAHPGVLAGSQGSMELLPGGNVFVGWGQEPYFTEFAAGGQIVLDGTFPGHYESYRAYLQPWTGHPTSPPALAVKSANSTVTLYASWNGATEVANWRVLAGADASHLQPVATANRTGFETSIVIKSGGPAFEVQALDSTGAVLGTSAAVK